MGERKIQLPEPGLEEFDRLCPGVAAFILDAVYLVETQDDVAVRNTMLACEGYLAFASQQRAIAERDKRNQECQNFARLVAFGPDGKPLNSATTAENLKYITDGKINESYGRFKLWEALEQRLEGLRDTLRSYLRSLEKERERIREVE